MADNSILVDPTDSPLGSKEHWNQAYERELKNIEEKDDDIGEVWFGEDVQERVCDWIAQGCEDDDDEDEVDPNKITKGSEKFPGIRSNRSKVLDIGCGNAAALVCLAQEYGFTRLVGVDYSAPGIELAKKVVARNEDIVDYVDLQVLDLMDLENLHKSNSNYQFDLLFDKGTFDAICLNEDKLMRNKYVAAIVSMMKSKSSYFVITSCNWTRPEVIQMFESLSMPELRIALNQDLATLKDHESCSLKYYKHLQHPEYSFGGSVGSTVATVAFRLMPLNS